MTACLECRNLSGQVGHARGDLGTARGKLIRAREDDAPRFARIVESAKARLRTAEDALAEHQAGCTVPVSPRKVLDVKRRAKAAPKPERAPSKVIDREAVAAVLAVDAGPSSARRGSNVLEATGHCHTCDRRISGERRFCGPCAARRSR